MFGKMAVSLIILASPSALSAADPPQPSAPPPAPDGNISGLSEAVFLQLINSMTDNAISDKPKAEALQAAMRTDNVIDAAEADALNELIATNVRSIRVEPPSAKYRFFLTYTAFGEGRKVLVQTLRPLTKLRAAMNGGKDGWALLSSHYAQSATGKAEVLEVMADPFAQAAAASNHANRFDPFRKLVSGYYALTSQNNGAGREMLFDAAKAADASQADRLPDFLYNWVKPAPKP